MAVWTLMGLAFAMRSGFAIWSVRHGESVMPDAGAVMREGRVTYVARIVVAVFWIALFVSYGVDARWVRFANIGMPDQIRWAGLLVGLGSLAFWTWTHIALGQQWSVQLILREKHQLITTGPYRRVRHPMYTSVLLWVTSLAIVSANWLFVILAAAGIGVILSRVPKEEQMMLRAFGQEYDAYMKRTGRYFPRVRRTSRHSATPL